MLTGGCFCGEIRYELHDALGLVANCHCAFCRRIHGAPYTTISLVRADDIRWVGAEPCVYETPLGYRRHFCPSCAAPSCNFPPVAVSVGEFASVVIGSLDDDWQQRAWFHVNVESRLPWVDVDDGLPAFEGWPAPWRIRELAVGSE